MPSTACSRLLCLIESCLICDLTIVTSKYWNIFMVNTFLEISLKNVMYLGDSIEHIKWLSTINISMPFYVEYECADFQSKIHSS